MEATVPFREIYDAGQEHAKCAGEITILTADKIPGLETPLALLPQGTELVDLDDYLDKPVRIKESPIFNSVDSFIEYVNRFKDSGTQIFASLAGRSLTAKLDYPEPGKPRRQAHTAGLQLQYSPEWQLWTKHDRTPMEQKAFGEMLDDYIDHISEPTGAEMMDAVLNIEATLGATFKNVKNLRNGTVQIEYEEDVKLSGRSALTLPERFALRIPVYLNEEPEVVRARLRYKVASEGKLTFTYLIDQPERVLQHAFQAVCDVIRTSEGEGGTGIVPLQLK